jgi:hypothetical protein
VITQSSHTFGTLTVGADSGAKGTAATVYIGSPATAAKEPSEGATTFALIPLPASLDAAPAIRGLLTESG